MMTNRCCGIGMHMTETRGWKRGPPKNTVVVGFNLFGNILLVDSHHIGRTRRSTFIRAVREVKKLVAQNNRCQV